MKVIIPFILVFSVGAKILKYEVTGSKRTAYELKEACSKMGHKHLLLVEALDISTIDCMGSKLPALDYCKSIYESNPKYIRGFLQDGKVICQQGEEVFLSISCDKRDQKYCEEAKSGCAILKKSFAVNHNLVHQSLNFGKLSCYFSSQKI